MLLQAITSDKTMNRRLNDCNQLKYLHVYRLPLYLYCLSTCGSAPVQGKHHCSTEQGMQAAHNSKLVRLLRPVDMAISFLENML